MASDRGRRTGFHKSLKLMSYPARRPQLSPNIFSKIKNILNHTALNVLVGLVDPVLYASYSYTGFIIVLSLPQLNNIDSSGIARICSSLIHSLLVITIMKLICFPKIKD